MTEFKTASQLKLGDVFLTTSDFALTPWRRVVRIDYIPSSRHLGILLEGQSTRYELGKSDIVEVMK